MMPFSGKSSQVDRRQRRFLTILTVVALLCVAAQAFTGVAELTLYLTPLFLIAALLLSGHYIAEERIVAAWRGSRSRPLRRAAPRVHLRRERALTSLLERAPRSLRGPPALLPRGI